MTESIIVSYVVTVFNKAPYLEELFDTLWDQMPLGAAEFLFVDDRSTDGSYGVLERIRSAVPANFRHLVRILQSPVNAGPAAATNLGCKEAQGRYIHFVDGDDRLPVGATAAMVDAAQRSRADLVYGDHKVMGSTRAVLPNAPPELVSVSPLSDMINWKLVGVRFLASRDAYNRSGGADEALFIMDCSLPWRMASVSKRLVYLRTPLVERRVHAAGRMSENRNQELHDFLGAALGLLSGGYPLDAADAKKLRLRCLIRLARHARKHGDWRGLIGYIVAAATDRLSLLSQGQSMEAIEAGQRSVAKSGVRLTPHSKSRG